MKVIGGLGNQMFQYALGRALAKKHSAQLVLDITDFKDYEFHAYSLEHFNIEKVYASEKEVAYFKKFEKKNGKAWIPYNMLFADPKKYVRERTYTFDPAVLDVEPSCYLDGYWQTEKYFLDVADAIRDEFRLITPLSDYSADMAAKIHAAPIAVSLHVRRGDFVKHAAVGAHHGICPPEYYEDAIKLCIERLGSPHFFVFSDDIEWARENIHTGCPTEFIGQGPDRNYEDLELMRQCTHHILSNSTFGWWGAWLSDIPGTSLNIAPKTWFKKPTDISDLVPERWVILPY